MQSYEVLVRGAEDLGVSRGATGLTYAGGDEGPMLFDEVTEDMRRRALLAAATTSALFGAPISLKYANYLTPEHPTPLPMNLLPSRHRRDRSPDASAGERRALLRRGSSSDQSGRPTNREVAEGTRRRRPFSQR